MRALLLPCLLLAACLDGSSIVGPPSCGILVEPQVGSMDTVFDGSVAASSGASCAIAMDSGAAKAVACDSKLFSSSGSQLGAGVHRALVTVTRGGMSGSCSAQWTVLSATGPDGPNVDMAVPGVGGDMATMGVTDMAQPTPDLEAPFSLATTTILNAPADVASWPITTTITQVDLHSNGIKFNFNKKGTTCATTPLDPTTTSPGSWPDVPYGTAGGSIEYTFWMIERVNGKWYASADLEFWCGLDRYPAAPSALATGGFYDAGRWGVLANRVPPVGEMVGFMVTQGDSRNNGFSSLKERSNVVFVPFPADATGGTFNF